MLLKKKQNKNRIKYLMKKNNLYQNHKRDFSNIVVSKKQFRSLLSHLTVVPDDQKAKPDSCPIKQVTQGYQPTPKREIFEAIDQKCHQCYLKQCKIKMKKPSHFWRVEVGNCEYTTCPLYKFRAQSYCINHT